MEGLAEKKGLGTALKTRIGSEAVSGSFPNQLSLYKMEEKIK